MEARLEIDISADQNTVPLDVNRCLLYNIEREAYTKMLRMQHVMHARCVDGEIPGVLILVEHDPTFTMGVKTSSRGNMLVSPEVARLRGIEVVETDRGGDVTYHGPGQLVGYPIVRLREVGGDLHHYLRTIEQSVIDTLAHFGLEGTRNGPAGVWVGEKKLCSIGIAVRKWVTYHGFALNVNPDLSHFSLINPCGLASDKISSMAQLLGAAPDMREVREVYARCFAAAFDLVLAPWPGGDT